MMSKLHPLSEEEFSLLKQGSRCVFRRVYDNYMGLIQFICFKFDLKQEEADEIVQETFLQLHLNLPKLETKDGVKSWLAITAKRKIIDLKRKKYKEKKHDEPSKLDNIAGDLGADLCQKIQWDMEIELTRDLVEEIAKEPGGTTFKEFYALGLPVKEIAEKNKESISAVTTRLSRLRKKYRHKIVESISELRASTLVK